MDQLHQKKSICFLTDLFIMGGVERVIIETVWELHNNYAITIFVLYGTSDPTVMQQLPPDIQVIFLNLRGSRTKSLLLACPILGGQYIDRLLHRKNKYDYLVSLKPATIMASFSKSGQKKIYWCHMDKDLMYQYPKQLNIFRRINKIRLFLGYQKYDHIWTVSNELTNGLRRAFRLNSVSTLSNPIDCASIQAKASEPCNFRFSSKINIIMVGRLSQEKGFTRVINALGKLDCSTYHLYIIGEGNARNEIDAAIHSCNLQKYVTLLGNKNNPYKYMRQAQLLICPSYSESFGLVMLEAMLLKVPVITTNTVGGREITQNGTFGTLINNSDEAITYAISDFLKDPTQYCDVVDKSYEWATQYDISHFRDKIRICLETIA